MQRYATTAGKKDGPSFWCHIYNMKDAVGNYVMRDLATFALKLHSLPISNATVERVFSRVTSVKSKLRNRMCLEMLDSILRIKMLLEEKKICCTNFEPTSQMYNYTSEIYKKEKIENEEEFEEREAEEILDILLD